MRGLPHPWRMDYHWRPGLSRNHACKFCLARPVGTGATNLWLFGFLRPNSMSCPCIKHSVPSCQPCYLCSALRNHRSLRRQQPSVRANLSRPPVESAASTYCCTPLVQGRLLCASLAVALTLSVGPLQLRSVLAAPVTSEIPEAGAGVVAGTQSVLQNETEVINQRNQQSDQVSRQDNQLGFWRFRA